MFVHIIFSAVGVSSRVWRNVGYAEEWILTEYNYCREEMEELFAISLS